MGFVYEIVGLELIYDIKALHSLVMSAGRIIDRWSLFGWLTRERPLAHEEDESS